MKRYSACFALFLLALAPSSVSEATPNVEAPPVRRVSESFQPAALAEFKRALAAEAAEATLQLAKPLKMNGYKVNLSKTLVRRALLSLAG